MVVRGVRRRIRQALDTFERREDWDLAYVTEDLQRHYMLAVPALAEGAGLASAEEAEALGEAAASEAFQEKLRSLDEVTDEQGHGFAGRLLSLVMLNVIDEKWKDHLYDLDQLRSSIHYRSWGQKDPLVEYKQEAFVMFEDLMHDLANTFTERFLKAHLVFEAPPEPVPLPPAEAPRPPRRFNALGILEEMTLEETEVGGDGTAEEPSARVARGTPAVVGAGGVRSLAPAGGALPSGWEQTARNDACPCGSGKKFKKCHGAAL
jgi:preprotein translocase subunit SecA